MALRINLQQTATTVPTPDDHVTAYIAIESQPTTQEPFPASILKNNSMVNLLVKMNSRELKKVTDHYIIELETALKNRETASDYVTLFVRMCLEQIKLANTGSYLMITDKCSIKLFGDGNKHIPFPRLNYGLIKLIHDLSTLIQAPPVSRNNNDIYAYYECLDNVARTMKELKDANTLPFFAGGGTAILAFLYISTALIECLFMSPTTLVFAPFIAVMLDICRVAFSTGYQYDGLIKKVEPLLVTAFEEHAKSYRLR